MSTRTDRQLLEDIQEAIRRAQLYTADLDCGQFLKDLKTQDAVLRILAIIGEATKGLSSSLREGYPSVPWRNMAGARDKLIHDYFGVNLEIVWTIVTQDLPELAPQIHRILDEQD